MAFSSFLECGSNLEAEHWQSPQGVGFMHFSHFFLEIDSIVFQMIEGERQPNYKLNLTIEKI